MDAGEQTSMKDIADEIRSTVSEASELLARMEPSQVASKASPEKWSKQEILGHMIDSASNNHQRFVRAATNTAALFPPYNQIDWVRVQRYGESDWPELVAFWSLYNRHLCHILERMPQKALSAPCNLGKEEPVQLQYVVRDYLRHLRHHLCQIFEREG